MDVYQSIKLANTDEERASIIKQCGRAIKFVANPSPQLQLIAITKDPFALQFIKHPAKGIRARAILSLIQKGYSIKEIKSKIPHYIVDPYAADARRNRKKDKA